MSVILRNPTDNYGNCSRCRAYAVHFKTHACPPEWRVWVDGDDPEFAGTVFARDEEAAAETYCDENDCHHDYMIIRNEGAVLIVERDGREVRVQIEAESRPTYSASVMEP